MVLRIYPGPVGAEASDDPFEVTRGQNGTRPG